MLVQVVGFTASPAAHIRPEGTAADVYILLKNIGYPDTAKMLVVHRDNAELTSEVGKATEHVVTVSSRVNDAALAEELCGFVATAAYQLFACWTG